MSLRALGTLSPLDQKLSNLKTGDEVIVLAGEGSPAVLKETTTIVWQVYGPVVVTNNGITLKSSNLTDLIITGRRFETFQTSHDAFHVVGKLVAELKEAEDNPAKKYLGGAWDEPFPSEPE